MADVPVPSIVTATPDGDDTVLGVKDGLVKRFTLDNVGAGINFSAINATTNMVFNTNATEKMRLDSAGNVGIGTSSPSNRLQVNVTNNTAYSSSNTLAGGVIGYIRNDSTTNSTDATLRFDALGSASVAASSISGVHTGDGRSAITFGTRSSNSTDVTERARIDSAGNLGLGVTPSAWNTVTAFQAKNASFSGYSNSAYLAANWYYASGDKYIASDYATQYQQGTGKHMWFTAPSGTAGDAISFTQAMTLDASGNLLVGGTANSFSARIYSLETSATEKNNLALYTTGAHNTARIALYNDAGSASVQSISGSLSFSSGGVGSGNERMRIDSSGNLITNVNGTAPTLATNSTMSFELTSNTSLKIVVRGTDGTTRSTTLTLS